MTPEQQEEIRALRRDVKFMGNPHERAAMLAKADTLEGLDAITPIPALPAGVTTSAVPVKHGWIIRCPACALEGRDTKGEHLLIYNDGGFACPLFATIKLPDGSRISYYERDVHRAKIRDLLHLPTKADPLAAERRRLAEQEAALIAELAKRAWADIRREFAGGISTIGKSGKRPLDFSAFCEYCGAFNPGDLAWAGTRWDKSETQWEAPFRPGKERFRFRDHLYDPHNPVDRAEVWKATLADKLDHASGAAWKPTATGRDDKNWKCLRFLVVEHDGPKDAPTPLCDQVAAIRFAMSLGWNLRYVVATGGKGVHGIFDVSSLSPSKLAEDISTLISIGVDPGGLTHARTRTPGCVRRFDGSTPGGNLQEILWIAP